jgi:hypothetical protein
MCPSRLKSVGKETGDANFKSAECGFCGVSGWFKWQAEIS